MSATERQLVLNLAVADWRGGYRMPPSLDTARGCVRALVPPEEVDRAARFYAAPFRGVVDSPRPVPEVTVP